MTDIATLAYAAGLFDGEGSIIIRKRTQRGCLAPVYSLHVSVANTDLPIIEWLQEAWPGHLCKTGLPAKAGRRHAAWKWNLTSRIAAAFLRDVQPYLRIKAEQARIAIELADLIAARNRGLPLTDADVAARDALREELLAQPGRGHRRGDTTRAA